MAFSSTAAELRGSRLWTQSGFMALALVGIFVLTLVPRLVELRPTITSDEGYWMQRSVRFGAALARLDLGQTFRSGHPGVTTMWVGLIGIGPERLQTFLPTKFTNYTVLEKHPDYLDSFFAARRAIVVTTSLLLAAAVGLAWRLLGPGAALTGGALLALEPYQVGSSQLLHVDTLLAPLVLLGLLAGFNYWFAGRQPRYLVLTAVLIGLSVLTKAPGIALPIYLSAVAVLATRPWKHGLQPLLPWIGCGALSLLVYFALWPTMWVEAPRRIPQVIRFAASVGGNPHSWPNYFLGQPLLGDPGPLYYPLALALRMSPLVLIGLAALVFVHIRRPERIRTVVALVGFVVFFICLMSIGAKKFDRYLLPAIGVMTMLAGAGVWWLAARVRQTALRLAVVAVPIAAQSMLFWQAQPYPLAAYSPLAGGIEAARNVMMVGWGEGLDQVADYLNSLPEAESLVAKTHYHHALRPMFRGSTVRVPDPSPVNYFVVYVNMAQRVLIPTSVLQIIESRPPDFTATVNGSEYAWVYRVDGVVEPGPDSAEEDED